MNEYKVEIGCPVAQDLVGWGKERERPALRMFAAALIPTLEHGFSVAWFQIETKFYFGNHWMENCDFHVTIVQ